MDVTLTANGRDFHARLSSYEAQLIPEYDTIIRTRDGKEHYGRLRHRLEVSFMLIPYTDEAAEDDYTALSAIAYNVTATVPELGGDVTRLMRCTSNLDSVFGLRSIDGNRYYKRQNKIVLRALECED